MIDLSKIRPGDEVTVRGIVGDLGGNGRFTDGDIQVVFGCKPGEGAYRNGKHEGPINPRDIASHAPKAPAVGDWAIHHEHVGKFRIVAVDDGVAWCRWEDGSRGEVPVSGLERVS